MKDRMSVINGGQSIGVVGDGGGCVGNGGSVGRRCELIDVDERKKEIQLVSDFTKYLNEKSYQGHSGYDEQIMIKRVDLTTFVRKFASENYIYHQQTTRLTGQLQRQAIGYMRLKQQYQLLKNEMIKITQRLQQTSTKQQKLNKQIIVLQQRVKYEQSQNERNRKFIKIKQDIIKNIEWQKNIIMEQKEEIKKNDERWLYERMMRQRGGEECERGNDVKNNVKMSIKTQEEYPDAGTERKKSRSIIIRKGKQSQLNVQGYDKQKQKQKNKQKQKQKYKDNELQLQQRIISQTQYITQLQNKLQLFTIQKEHVYNQYKLAQQRGQMVKQCWKKDQHQMGLRSVRMLAEKCLMLEQQVQVLMEPLKGEDMGKGGEHGQRQGQGRGQRVRVIRAKELNVLSEQPITPHFSKTMVGMFPKCQQEIEPAKITLMRLENHLRESQEKENNLTADLSIGKAKPVGDNGNNNSHSNDHNNSHSNDHNNSHINGHNNANTNGNVHSNGYSSGNGHVNVNTTGNIDANVNINRSGYNAPIVYKCQQSLQ